MMIFFGGYSHLFLEDLFVVELRFVVYITLYHGVRFASVLDI